MADNTKIEWADHTWSPWIGCQKVGPGCDHCYAEALNKRAGGGNWGPGAPRRRTSKDYWRKPYRWNTHAPGKVFPSMCDPFDNAVEPELRTDFGWLIRETPNLTWLLLTKRIGNAAPMLGEMFNGAPPPNVWVGATFVNRDEMLRDAHKLKTLPVSVRFWSVEPMLGGLGDIPTELMPEWVICGGESGPGARPIALSWARHLRDQCEAAGVAFLFKQWGEWAPAGQAPAYNIREFGYNEDERLRYHRVGKKRAGRLLDGVEHNGMPEVRHG